MNTRQFVALPAAMLLSTAAANAGIINGNFENGLTGWTIEWGSWSTPPLPGGNHVAACSEDCYLSQIFELPAGAQTLSFKYRFFHSGTPGPGPNDFLKIQMLDPGDLTPLIPPAVGDSDSGTIVGEDHNGIYFVNADYTSVSPIMPDNFHHVSVDVSFLPPQQDVRFQFVQFGFTDGQNSTIVADDVAVIVPEPVGVVPLLLAVTLIRRRVANLWPSLISRERVHARRDLHKVREV